MVDDVRNINETAESKEAIDRARLARERREAEQRKRLDELRAHAAAAQAQREKRDEDRRKRQAEQRARDDDRRLQVEERKRAIWEASISRREALLQRERDRAERLERARAARSSPRPAFAFGSSTPRLLDPLDSAGFFWAARSTNPIDQMNYFDSLAASTTNVMFASAPLTRRASALQLDSSDTDNKDEPDRQPPPAWSSVARRRTDLVPTVPLGRAPGRAHSMTRLDRLPPTRPLHSASPSMHHLNRTQPRSGETTPGSRPGSALSTAAGGTPVVRRPSSAPRKPRPASIAGTGVNTPRAGVGENVSAVGGSGASSAATTPCMSRDGSVGAGAVGVSTVGVSAVGEAPRRAHTAPRRPRPVSLHAHSPKPAIPATPGDGKPPVHRKPKPSKEHDKSGRGKSWSASPGRALSPAHNNKDAHDKDKPGVSSVSAVSAVSSVSSVSGDKSQVSAAEVTQKLEALQVQERDATEMMQTNENKDSVETNEETKPEHMDASEEKTSEKPAEVQKPVEKKEVREEKREERKEPSQEKTEENDMTASMSGRRITTEEEAKAALAERRRRAREELERQADRERQRLQREAEEEAERQRLEEERQRREEEEARELAQLQRRMEEEKLRKAIEAQQQLEREEAERKVREEAERQARLREEEEKRKAAEEAERLRREEAEKEEKERLLRKQRVEAIMARTRLRKQAEEQKQQEKPAPAPAPVAPAPTDSAPAAPAPAGSAPAVPAAAESAPANSAPVDSAPADSAPAPSVPAATITQDNGNVNTGDLLGFNTSQVEETQATQVTQESVTVTSTEQVNTVTTTNTTTNNGNLTADLLGLSQQNNTEDTKSHEQVTSKQQTIDNAPPNQHQPTNNGNLHAPTSNIGHVSANFLHSERAASDANTQPNHDMPNMLDDDFTTHNGHGHSHPLTLQNAI